MSSSAVLERGLSLDAIVVVPGIMGSELADGDGRQIWGLAPKDLAAAYAGDLLDRLRVTDEDLDGTRGVTATRLLRYPGLLAWFRGSEDYTRLLKRAGSAAVRPGAVITFPYDWRLSITTSGALLAKAAVDHWERWRRHIAAENLGDPSKVALTVVAHSMGGLVTRAAQQSGGLAGLPLRVITLGTPFYGSVKALRLLAAGEGGPLPGLSRDKLQRFAQGSPGLHDLMPRYRCVAAGDNTRSLTVEDIVTLGGDAEVASAAAERWAGLDWQSGPGNADWRSGVGVNQPTLQSATFTGTGVEYQTSLLGQDADGDGTVYRAAAGPGWAGYSATPLNQTHAALVASPESFQFVRDKLLHRDDAPPLGTSFVSVDFPDIAQAGTTLQLRAARYATGDGDPYVENSQALAVGSTNLDSGTTTQWHPVGIGADGWLTAAHPGLAPGLHRIAVSGGASSPVTELLWVGDSA